MPATPGNVMATRSIEQGEGGGGLSARADSAIDVPAREPAARQQGVTFFGGARYDRSSGEAPFLRLGFSHANESELDDANGARATRITVRW